MSNLLDTLRSLRHPRGAGRPACVRVFRGTGAPKRGQGASAISYHASVCRPAFIVVFLIAACAWVAVHTAPAFAEHPFGSSFGEACAAAPCGPNQFSDPSGIAISNETGDVYVADKGNNRVEYFTSTGTFIAMFGKDVNKTKTLGGVATEAEKNVCEAAEVSVECQAGTPGIGPGQLKSPEGIAVDNSGSVSDPSNGDVYVANRGADEVQTVTEPASGNYQLSFENESTGEIPAGSSDGEVQAALEGLTKIGGGSVRVEVEGATKTVVFQGSLADTKAPQLAITPSGDTAIVTEGSHPFIDKFSSAGKYAGQLAAAQGGAPFAELKGVAVDPQGQLWVYQENKQIDAFSDAQPNVFLSGRGSQASSSADPGFAVNSEDDLYVAHGEEEEGEVEITKLNSKGEELQGGLGGFSGKTGVAVESSSNDVYIDSGESGTPAIQEFSPEGKEIESFGVEQLVDRGGRALAVSYASVSKADVYVVDSAESKVDIFPYHAPPVIVESESTAFLESASVELEAQIDPNGFKAPYHFEYGSAAGAYQVSLPVPDAHTTASPAGVGVSVLVKGLQPGTTYHYRVVAVNQEGEAVDGPDQTFTTTTPQGNGSEPNCPNEQLRTEQPFALALPDCRAYEIVSPEETGGQDATDSFFPASVRASICGKECEEREDPALTYAAKGSFGNPTGASNTDQFVSRRNATKERWETQAIDPLQNPEATENVSSFEATVFTPELETGIAATKAALPSTGAPGGEAAKLYMSDFATGSYQYLGSGLVPLGASTDLSHVVFGEHVSASGGGGYVSEWVDGRTLPVSVTNEGTTIEATVGTQFSGSLASTHEVWHAVSANGSRVYFSSPPASGGAAALYVRENAEQEQSPLTAHGEASGTGTLTAGSPEVTSLVTATAGAEGRAGGTVVHVGNAFSEFAVGEQVIGAYIQADTTITAIDPEDDGQLTLSKSITGNAEPPNDPSEGFQLSAIGPAPFAVGQRITGAGIPSGTTIIKAEEGKLTLSKPAAFSGSEVALEAAGECTEPADACTIEVSASQRFLRANPAGTQPARYWGASADGSRTFFTSNAELTEDAYTGEPSSEAPKAANLYEYDLATGKLNDLTGESLDSTGEGAAVQGVVQISEDGSYLYFVANGALAAGASEQQCREESEEEATGAVQKQSNLGCNLYVSHEGGAPVFIAKLEQGDESDWNAGSGPEGGPEINTAVVTADGSQLAFISERRLPTVNFPAGYDNQQATGGECEGKGHGGGGESEAGRCREVFLYDAGSGGAGSLVCASCDPTGARPVGPSSFASVLGDASAQYRPRNLLADGSLFFDSSDALVASASDGRRNVYEYEAGHVYAISNVAGGEESFFLDASPSGQDVFFGSANKLLPQDTSDNVVVWDARQDGGFPVPPAAPSCSNADSCKPPESSQPALFGLPASATFSGPGDATPAAPAVVKKVTKKAATCKKGDIKNKRGRCVKKPKKKSKAKRAGHNRRASR
jgi:hypothetical protein